MASEIVRIDEFGVLKSGLRNIRCSIENKSAVFDLVPERLVEPNAADVDDGPAVLRKLHKNSQLVVEGSLALRLEFELVLGIAVDTDIDVDLFGGLLDNWDSAPRVGRSSLFYPLLEVKNSPWKAQLPEWRLRDDPAVRHIRMISAECSFEVLGVLTSGAWTANAAE